MKAAGRISPSANSQPHPTGNECATQKVERACREFEKITKASLI